MARDSLATLIKLRRLACDEAQRRLVDSLSHEDRAERAVQSIDRSIAAEFEAAARIDSADAVVEAFGAWLPEARRQLEAARQTLGDRQAETTRSRAELSACRGALESVETLQQERRDRVKAARDKMFERDLDDRPPAPQDVG